MTKLQKFCALVIGLAILAMLAAGCDGRPKIKTEFQDLRSFPTAEPVHREGHSGQNF